MAVHVDAGTVYLKAGDAASELTGRSRKPTEGGRASRARGDSHVPAAYCGVGCGVIIETSEGRISGVRGDPEHPANFGRLCTKGSNAAPHGAWSRPRAVP